jgi:hypothetical protein
MAPESRHAVGFGFADRDGGDLMASEKQVAANRRNAQRSSGPKTAAGKARAARNGLQHGLLAQPPVLPDEDPAMFEAHAQAVDDELRPVGALERECVQRISQLTWRLHRVARLETAVLTAQLYQQAVDGAQKTAEMAEDQLRREEVADVFRRRGWRTDIKTIVRETAGQGVPAAEIGDDSLTMVDLVAAAERNVLAAKDALSEDTPRLGLAFLQVAAGLATLSRYETSLVRNLGRALDQLEQLQQVRREEEL